MICRRVKFFPSLSSSSFPSHLCPPLQCFLSYYGCPDTNVASKHPVKPITQWCVSLCWGKFYAVLSPNLSKYHCEVIIVAAGSYWQIIAGSVITGLLYALSSRQKIGLNICLVFCCMNVDPAALITSDSDNKGKLPEKHFPKTSSWM